MKKFLYICYVIFSVSINAENKKCTALGLISCVRPMNENRGLYNLYNMNEEIWKDVVGFEGHYQISSNGNIRSENKLVKTKSGSNTIRKGRLLAKCYENNRYYTVQLSANGVSKRAYIHRLVATAFIPNPENKPQVNHKNGNKIDNQLENLEWCTFAENNQHAIKTGLIVKYGDNTASAKLTENQVIAIKRLQRINPKFNRTSVARKLGVSPMCVSQITTEKRWAYLTI